MIPFNRPYTVGREHANIEEAIALGQLSGNGVFGRRCSEWLRGRVGSAEALITPSCSAALEMAIILAGIGPGDEVIMPSFTFVSTANAVAVRGGVPVFVDIREDTLNIDETKIEGAITERTRAIVVVHYAGVACDMDPIMRVARAYNLMVIEDAAHGIQSAYRGRPLGSIGDLATFSFHETKNVQCGEGGALLVNDPALVRPAEILQDKGTNRRSFFRGEVDKYTWVDVGSSYLLSELAAAFLWAQLEHAEEITARRLAIWHAYQDALAPLEELGVRRPIVPADCVHNAHLYYLLLPDAALRPAFLEGLKELGVQSVFHYVPLHSSPGGERFARAAGDLPVTDLQSARLIRLPVWVGMTDAQVRQVIAAVTATAQRLLSAPTASSRRAA